MEFPVKFPLSRPVTFGEETISELELREPVAGDLWDVELGEKIAMGALLSVAAAISGRPLSVLRKLSAPDALELATVVGGFFERSPETSGS